MTHLFSDIAAGPALNELAVIVGAVAHHVSCDEVIKLKNMGAIKPDRRKKIDECKFSKQISKPIITYSICGSFNGELMESKHFSCTLDHSLTIR